MDTDLDRAIEDTGLCIPLAARILRLLAESGASQIEIGTALELVSHLRHHLSASLVQEELARAWSDSAGSDPGDTA
jgi:hypothetical protein